MFPNVTVVVDIIKLNLFLNVLLPLFLFKENFPEVSEKPL